MAPRISALGDASRQHFVAEVVSRARVALEQALVSKMAEVRDKGGDALAAEDVREIFQGPNGLSLGKEAQGALETTKKMWQH